MTGIAGGSGGGGGYDYVQNPEPADPEEGEEWYDTGSNQAFVYDGEAWIEQTVTSHAALSGLDQDDHPQYATDNKVDNHAADAAAHHSRPTGTNSAQGAVHRVQLTDGDYRKTVTSGQDYRTFRLAGRGVVASAVHYQTSTENSGVDLNKVTVVYADGSTQADSSPPQDGTISFSEGFVSRFDMEFHNSSGYNYWAQVDWLEADVRKYPSHAHGI